jgi:hypothetical protein
MRKKTEPIFPVLMDILVTGPTRFGDDASELVDLLLGAAKGSELRFLSVPDV